MSKSPQAFRTIREVADWLDVAAHVLRFWESKFPQIKPVKRAGGRRYYRPGDMELVGGIKVLLHEQGMTIKGVQNMLASEGVGSVSSLAPPLEAGLAAEHEPDNVDLWETELQALEETDRAEADRAEADGAEADGAADEGQPDVVMEPATPIEATVTEPRVSEDDLRAALDTALVPEPSAADPLAAPPTPLVDEKPMDEGPAAEVLDPKFEDTPTADLFTEAESASEPTASQPAQPETQSPEPADPPDTQHVGPSEAPMAEDTPEAATATMPGDLSGGRRGMPALMGALADRKASDPESLGPVLARLMALQNRLQAARAPR
ncbi:MAG: MerR family transcriptional regulator [Pseudomonadota bacterium]